MYIKYILNTTDEQSILLPLACCTKKMIKAEAVGDPLLCSIFHLANHAEK